MKLKGLWLGALLIVLVGALQIEASKLVGFRWAIAVPACAAIISAAFLIDHKSKPAWVRTALKTLLVGSTITAAAAVALSLGLVS